MSEKFLPQGWKVGRLGDRTLARTVSGGTPNRSVPEYFNGNVPWTKSGELNDNYIFDTEEKITNLGLKNSSAKIFPKGTLLIAMYGATAGKTGILGLDATTNQAVCAIFPINDSFDSNFLQYYLIHIREEILCSRSGGAQPNISQRVIGSLEVILPPLPEQRAIARALRAVQASREARLQEAKLERERKAALMEHLFRHGTRGEATKQTEIGEMPESWEAAKFEKVITSSAYGPRFSSDYYDSDGNVATLRTTDLDNEGNINYLTMPLAKLKLESFEQHLLKPNDFLITRSGTCGIAAIFEPFEKPVLPGAFLIRFRLSNEIKPQFLKYYINSPTGRNRILQLAGGAVQKNLSGTSLRSFQIPLPSPAEQEVVVRSFMASDAKIAALGHEARLLDELFRAMLVELMSGRLSATGLINENNMIDTC